jgi:peroxiredoxin
LRDHYDEITAKGGEVIAVGTGNVAYAQSFVADEHLPFPVLVDDDARAARAASVRSVGFFKLLFDRDSFQGMRRARAGGHRIHKSGSRVTQLGATFVLGPGDAVWYEHVDADSTDHAAIPEVLAAAGA